VLEPPPLPEEEEPVAPSRSSQTSDSDMPDSIEGMTAEQVIFRFLDNLPPLDQLQYQLLQ